MIPEIGHYSLILCTVISLFAAISLLIPDRNGYGFYLSKQLTRLSLSLALVSIAALLISFLNNDFSVTYVAHNSNTSLAWYFKVAALWGGHQGSILFWSSGLLLATASIGARGKSTQFLSQTRGLMALLSFGFLLFILLTSNPFDRLLPEVPIEGRDLNPMLQSIGLILHPPLIFFGYVGLSVLFCGALTVLINPTRSIHWQWFRHWNLLAWVSLTLGNLFGAWWAYNELGWGGWWFWDPVENASFIPWLISTALMHSLQLNQSKGALTLTSIMLALAGLSVSLVGTFMVRSGIIQSVHAFAAAPDKGVGILLLLVATLMPALGLLAWRTPQLPKAIPLPLLSRGYLVMISVALLTIAAFSVMLGTCYPFIFKGLGLGSISVGAPYFNTIFIPIVTVCVLILGWVSLSKTQQRSVAGIAILALALFSATLTCFWQPTDRPEWLFQGVFSFVWLSGCLTLASTSSAKRQKPWLAIAAHGSLAIFILGATVLSHFEQSAMVKMGPGKGRELAGYTAIYEQTNQLSLNSYHSQQAQIRIEDADGNQLKLLFPERRTYLDDMAEMTVADVHHSLLSDFYLSMGPKLEQQDYLIRISYKPWVKLLWIGGVLAALFGFLSLFRQPKESK